MDFICPNEVLVPIDERSQKAIYFTGGHGVMWDYTNQPKLTTFAELIYRQGGVISAVCHGVAGLFALEDEQGRP